MSEPPIRVRPKEGVPWEKIDVGIGQELKKAMRRSSRGSWIAKKIKMSREI